MAHYAVGSSLNSNEDFEIITVNFSVVEKNSSLKIDLEKKVKESIQIIESTGLHIKGYIKEITKIYDSPEPTGFDFKSTNPTVLLKLVERNKRFHFDDPNDPIGKVMALVTLGKGFRQIGAGPSIHIEIDEKTNECNAHVDSHGFVDNGGYNCDRMLSHGVWDLMPGYAPWLYGHLGGVTIGPYAALNVPLDLAYFGKLSEFSSLPTTLPRFSPTAHVDLGLGLRAGGLDIGISKRFDSSGPINKYAEIRAAYYFSKGPLSGRVFGVIDTTGKWEGQAESSLNFGRLSVGAVGRIDSSSGQELQLKGSFGDIVSAQIDPLGKSGSILIDLTGFVSP